jgi:hypothetical protein
MNNQNQFGLFAKDSAGNPMEIGTAPGQANLFDRERFKARSLPMPSAPVSDIPGQETMFSGGNIGIGICDGGGERKTIYPCDGAPLAGGAICADCLKD